MSEINTEDEEKNTAVAPPEEIGHSIEGREGTTVAYECEMFFRDARARNMLPFAAYLALTMF